MLSLLAVHLRGQFWLPTLIHAGTVSTDFLMVFHQDVITLKKLLTFDGHL